MTDITNSSSTFIPNPNYDANLRLRRILDEDPALPERALDHELAPYIPLADKSIGDQIADKSISVVDEAASHVLAQLRELTEQIAEAEQMVLASQVEVREMIRAHMRIVAAAAAIRQQVKTQLAEAMKPLADLVRKGAAA